MERSGMQGRTSYGTAYVAVGLVLAFLLGVYFVYPIRAVVQVFLLALLLSIVISAPVDYLARRRMPRLWGPSRCSLVSYWASSFWNLR